MGIAASNYECQAKTNANNIVEPIECTRNIGYTQNSHYLFLIFSLLGILTNIYIIITYFRQKKESHKPTQ